MFKKVLIANRGEIALRVMATCNKLGVETVAVYSDADETSLHVEKADSALRIGPAAVQKSYLNQRALLEAIQTSGCDAVHPGYGLLSENSEFSAAVRTLGVSFIGPESATLETFGDKLAARALARSLGILPPPGTETAVDPADDSGLRRAAEAIGLPLLVKATGGGGGIGMLKVTEWGALKAAADTCSQRGQAAFSDPRVYLERYIEAPRHIEVQVLGDGQGKAHVFGDRECSVQRRHQKLIEESPSPASFLSLRPETRQALHDAARRLVESQAAIGLATVEFVVDDRGNAFFLEVNPRLQVEHGITEMVFDTDLVQLQLEATAGDPCSLPTRTAPEGHAVEVRLYAEDPSKNFMPQPGILERFRFPEPGPTLRIDTGFRQGDVVTPYYDPLLAKVMTVGETRQLAIAHMLQALAGTQIAIQGKTGPKVSNIALMTEALQSAPFVSGDYTTHLIDELHRAG